MQTLRSTLARAFAVGMPAVVALCVAVAATVIWASPTWAQSQLPAVSISSGQTSAFEGEPVTFTLTRNGDTTNALTATVHSDEPKHPQFVPFVGSPVKTYHTVTFDAGASRATLIITPDSDGVVESDADWLQVEVDDASDSYQRGWPWQIGITIKDPSPVTITADPTSITEGESVTFTVTRSGSMDEGLMLGLDISDPGHFLRGNDWNPAPALTAVAAFSAGSATATISLQTKDDWRDVPDNSLTISSASFGFPGSGSVTVADNDTAPELELTTDKSEVEEGGTVTLTLQRHGDSENGVFAAISFDLEGQTTLQPASIAGDETVLTIPIAVEDNDLDEATRNYEARLLPITDLYPGAVESEYWTVRGSRAIDVRVTDNDPPVVGIEAVEGSYDEGDYGGFRLFRTGQTSSELVVSARLEELGHDIFAPYGVTLYDRTYTIPVASVDKNITIPLAFWDGDEHEGKITLNLLPSADYRLDPDRSTASFRVIDDDPTPTLSVTDASASEGDGAMNFEVTLSTSSSNVDPPSRLEVTVDYYTQHDSAIGGVDYTSTSGTLTITSHGTSGRISVPLIEDSLAEERESFHLVLTNPSNAAFAGAAATLTASGTIEDNEPSVSVESESDSVVEGESAVFVLKRDGDLSQQLTVGVTIGGTEGLATYGNRLVTFPAEDSETELEVATVDNDRHKPNGLEGVVVAELDSPETYSLPAGYHGNNDSSVIHVNDNERVVVTVTTPDTHRTEGEDVVFNLRRSGVPAYRLNADIRITGGDDFITGVRPTTATFERNSAQATVTIATENDAAVDDYDEITLEVLDNEPFDPGDPSSATVSMFDSTRAITFVSILANEAVVDEGEDAVFTLTRSDFGLADSLTVRVQVTDAGWERLSAPVIIGGSVRATVTNVDVEFDADSRTATIVHSTVDETLNDGNSRVKAQIRLGQYGIQPGSDRAETWVRDDDIPTVTVDTGYVARVGSEDLVTLGQDQATRTVVETGFDEWVEDATQWPGIVLSRTGDTSQSLGIYEQKYSIAWWPGRIFVHSGPMLVDGEVQQSGDLFDVEVGVDDAFEGTLLAPSIHRGTRYSDNNISAGESEIFDYRSPHVVGPLGGVIYYALAPFYCEDVPGDCGFRPQYQVGDAAVARYHVYNNAQGVRVESSQESVTEGDDVTFTLHRYGGRPADVVYPITVKVQVTQQGKFIEGVAPQTVTFAGSPDPVTEGARPGEISKTVTISTADDVLDEADGAITLTIIPLSAEEAASRVRDYEPETQGEASGWSSVATVQVLDNDEVGFSIADAAAHEDDGSIEFTVTLPAASELEISVDWATAPGAGSHPATPDEDYTPASGTLTFASGDTSKTVTVTVLDDDLKEENETFEVVLTNPSGGSLSDPDATGRINDDDETQTVSVLSDDDAGKLVEGEDVVFTLERCTGTPDSPEDCAQDEARGRLVVGLNVVTKGDFLTDPAPATAVFDAGSWTTTVTIPTDDDEQFEETGSVSLSVISVGSGLLTSGTSSTISVYDNDVPVSIADAAAGEGDGQIAFTVSLQEPAVLPVTVEVATRDGKATSHGAFWGNDFGKDFEPKREVITFAEGEQTKQFTVTLVDDEYDEEDTEGFRVRLRNPSNARLGDPSATGTISDDEEMVDVSLAIPAVLTFDENHSGPLRFQLEFGLTSGVTIAERDTAVHWVIKPGATDPATHGEDYVEAGGSILLPPGRTHGLLSDEPRFKVELHLLNDELFEPEELENLTVELTGAENLVVNPDRNSLKIKIRDDEMATAEIVADAASVTEGQEASFTVRLAGGERSDMVLFEYTKTGTAVEDDDYDAPVLPVGLIQVDEDTSAISIATKIDSVEETDETLTLTLGGALYRLSGRRLRVVGEPATVTILDAGTMSVSIAGATGREGDALEFTVSLSQAAVEPVTVEWQTPQTPEEVSASDTATPGVDYEVSSGTVTIPATSTSGTLTVQTLEDSVAGEYVESFVVTLTGASSDGSPVALGTRTALGDFLDLDLTPPTEVTLSASPGEVNEGADATDMLVTATLKGDKSRSRDTTVVVNVASGTATEDVDYVATSATVIIPAGSLSGNGTLTLTPVDDNIAEGDETVQVSGTAQSTSPLGTGQEIIEMTVTSATVTISDNDLEPTEITLAVSPDVVAEGAGASELVVTAELSGDSTASIDTSVTLTVEGVSLPPLEEDGDFTAAASVDDFIASAATVTIPAGEFLGTGTLTLTAADDPIAEGAETAQVNAAAAGMTVTPAPLTITDNDQEPTRIELSASPTEVSEDGGDQVLTVTATLAGGGARTEVTEVSVSVHGVTALAGEDFTQPSEVTVSIPAGQFTGSVSLTLSSLDDNIHEDVEELALRGTNAEPGLQVAETLVSIIDDDAVPTSLALSLDKEEIPEGAGAENLVVTATLEGDSRWATETLVSITASHVSTTDEDYFALPIELSIPGGENKGTADLLLTPMDDSIDEDDETFEVRGATVEVNLAVSYPQVVIIDDDDAGIFISTDTLAVLEGGNAQYTVALTSQPAGDVTVTVSGHSGTDLTLSGETLTSDALTFTADNWNTAQTVTVTAAADDDGVADDDVTLAHAISSADDTDYDALANVDLVVSITEKDAVGITLSPTTLTVTEGDAAGVSYTVVLTSQPTGDVTVAISGHANTDLTIASAGLSNDNDLTFTTANWGTAQTVTVKAAEDDDGVQDDDVTLSHAISSTDDSTYNALSDQSVTVSITEDDVVGVTINPTTLTVTEGDAAGVDYTVVLTSKPAGDVTVAISGHAGTDLTLSGTGLSEDGELTFTTANWGTAQTVTVKAAADDDGVTDADITLAHDISSADDAAYDALADQTVTVSITEDDVVGVTINPTTLTVPEGDATGVSYTVVLTSQPAGDVTVTISGHANTDLSIASPGLSGDDELTFTTANWGTAQTVTVKAAADDDGVQDDDVTLAHAISSADDAAYDALADQTVTVSITEDDVVGVTIDPTELTVVEGDASGVSYTVKLTSQPAGDVTVTISGHASTDLSIASPGLSGDDELTFTSANWSQAQTITLTAAEDDDGVADADVTLAHTISSSDDTDYNGLADQTVKVSITENDALGVTISPTTLTVTEGDATGVDYTVVLTSQPAGDVTVTVSGHSGTDLSISGTTLSGDNALTFTTENWSQAQTVTVKAAQDDDGVADNDVTLAHAISSTDDTDYDALANVDLVVSITEKDAVGITLSPTTLTVTEGDAAGVSYTVVLTSQPAGDVTVTVSGHSGTDLSISGTTLSGDDELTFTAANWNTAQTVTVKAAADDDGVTDADVTLAHAISSADDAAYDALADQSVKVSITENDAVGVTISPTDLTVTEGDATGVNYTVVLTSRPAGDVTVTVSGHSGTDLTLSGTTLTSDALTFTTANWGTAQTVTVKAAADDDAVADADVTLAHAISSADDAAYDALSDQAVTVSITENDAVGVTISPTTLTVTEGDATGVGYTVVLTSQPAGDVTVTISGHSGTDLSIASAGLSNDNVLTFTTANWSTAQRVTVKAAEDDDAVADADVTLAHAISSTDDSTYDALANQSVTVSITDNDAVGITLSPTTLTVNEGSTADYAVELSVQPSADVTINITGGADVTVDPTSLTFSTSTWDTAKTVRVTAAQDDDGTDDTLTVSHAVDSDSAAEYLEATLDGLPVTVVDDDSAGVTITPTALTALESRSNSYSVKLNTQPTGDVTVAISGHAGTALALSGTTLVNDALTFTPSNWDTPQTVTVTAGAVTADTNVTLSHGVSGGDYDSVTAANLVVTVVDVPDNQVTIQVGVTVSRQNLAVPEGGSNTYEVVLARQPTGDVTVTVTVDDTANNDVTTAEETLVFTTANWNVPKSVTVRAAEDDDAVTDSGVAISHTVSGADYEGVTAPGLMVSITENDALGVTISPTTLTVTEGDATGVDYTVVLTSQPAGDVTIAISGHSGTDLSISGTTLTSDALAFTADNWNTAQTVTVTAAADDDGVADADVTLAHAISSTDDTDYDALANVDLVVSITEDDANGVTINPTTLTVTEGDAAGVDYTVVLTSQPAGDVTVTVSGHSGTDLSISGTTLSGDNALTFTTANWNTAQTVTVTAAEDDDGVTDADVTLAHAISSTDDAAYDALADRSVTVSITEDDVVGLMVTPTTLSVTEGDATGVDYTVVLTSQPAGDVTVTISGHASTDLTLSGTGLSEDGELTFTTENWGTAQTVTVKAAADDDGVVDADISLTHAVSSTDDAAYDALSDQSVTVSITEDDVVGVTISPTTLTVTEGDATGVDYTVVLTSQPAGDVTVTITGHSGTDLSISGTTLSGDDELTFTAANWSQAQTVTVKAAADDDGVTDADVTLAHAISSADDAAYDALADQTVTVSITENDGPTVTVSFEKEVHYTIEGASGVAGVEVLLSAPLQTEVTIPITVLSQSTAALEDYIMDDSAGYASDPGLTFSPGETFGYVFIKAVLDTVDENTETVVLGFGTLPAGVSEGSPNRSTVEISDAIQVSFAESSYMVQEGSAGVEVMVRLNKPRMNLEIPLTATGHGGADDSDFTGVPKQVVFGDNETEKTFTVVAMADSEEENGEMIRLGFGAFSEGIVAIFPDSAMVMIDEGAGPPAPRHFAASWPTQTSITLTWFTVETAAEYKLEYRKHGESDWTRIIGDFDHLPSTSDHRHAFGVAAGLDCESDYEFRVSARGSGDTRNDGNRYPPSLFGSAATTSARTGECARVEAITNLLVSMEPGCATVTWTLPSGDRDRGYKVERYSYTDNRGERSEPETLAEQAGRVATRYQDCSAAYRTEGTEHVYIVSVLDDEGEEFGSAYTSIEYGPSWEPEGPHNVRLTRDTQSSRRLAWNAPRDPWLTTVKTALAGAGLQQVTLDPWTSGYRVERREYRMTEDGSWFLPEVDDRTLWSATMTVGEDSGATQRGYTQAMYGALTPTGFNLSSGRYQVTDLYVGTSSLQLSIDPIPPTDALEDWVLVIDGDPLSFKAGAIAPVPSLRILLVAWDGQSLNWNVGQQVTIRLVERSDWKALRYGADANTTTTFTDATDKGDRQYVYRVWPYNAKGHSRYSFRGDWAFNGGDPGGDPELAGYIPPPPAQQQSSETPPNTPATGAPAIGGTPQVGETLIADTSAIEDSDGLTRVSYNYQWVANNGNADTALESATDSTYAPSANDVGKTIKVTVWFTDDANNSESLTSVATAPVAATVPTAPLSLTVAKGDEKQELDASWQVPSSNGGSAVTSYKVQWKQAADSWDTAADVSQATETGTTHTITELTGGVEYAVRVIASNDAGDGPPSTEAKAVPGGGTSEQNSGTENAAPTGRPTISGTPQVEQTLTADTSNIDDADGLTNVSYAYQWLAGGTAISGATGASYTLTDSEEGDTIQVRVDFEDDQGNSETLTSVATDPVAAKPAPLTASFSNVPSSHDGSATFTFRVLFSEDVGISYVNMRDDAFTVTDGDVTGALRVDGRHDLWEITVEPDDNSDIVITLPADRSCSTAGAICTREDRPRQLTNSPSATVPGPSEQSSSDTTDDTTGEPTATSQLSVADATASEEDDSTIDFVVTLNPAGEASIIVDYATANGTASAGSDYTAQSGTLTFTAGETSQTVTVAIIDDSTEESDETLTLTLSNASGAEISDGQATGTITDSEPVPLTVSFSNVPDSHDGSTEFTFDLAFSENFELSYVTLRDHAFTKDAQNEDYIVAAQRKVPGSNQTWTITVKPPGNSTITITLPATTDCVAAGAICTDDGRKLSNSTTVTVSGPQ